MPSNKVRSLKERLYKDQIDGTTLFHKLISDRLTPDARVLDLGCGSGSELIDLRSEVTSVVGCDTDRSIRKNCLVSTRVQGDAYELPFGDGAFHIVIMDFVVEHLKFPDRCAREAFRVLKPGGCLILRTPNLYHYVSVVSRLTPYWFHWLIANRVRGLTGASERDVIATYYRANSRAAIGRVFPMAGFIVEHVIMVEREPSYLMFARPAFLLGYVYEQLVNRYESLANFRSNIFSVVKKPAL